MWPYGKRKQYPISRSQVSPLSPDAWFWKTCIHTQVDQTAEVWNSLSWPNLQSTLACFYSSMGLVSMTLLFQQSLLQGNGLILWLFTAAASWKSHQLFFQIKQQQIIYFKHHFNLLLQKSLLCFFHLVWTVVSDPYQIPFKTLHRKTCLTRIYNPKSIPTLPSHLTSTA